MNDILDRNWLNDLIVTLQDADKIGYQILSSPVEPLIEVMVDLSLKLREKLKTGDAFWERRFNKTLTFSKTEVDVLNNPKIFRSEVQRNKAWDPALSLFFEKLAQDLIRLKMSHKLPKDLYSYGKQRASSDRIKIASKSITSNYQYRRRTRLRKKR